MTNSQTVVLSIIRSLAFGGISGSYAPVGIPLAFPARLICFTNNTDGDMFFSVDGVNNYLFVASFSFKLFDLNTNRVQNQQLWVFPTNTQFYVVESTAPTKGAVYIEVLG
jgi:hypothetical protein